MNKYLEKIAARLTAKDAARSGVDYYQAHSALKKKKAKKKKKLDLSGRKFNRGTIRRNV